MEPFAGIVRAVGRDTPRLLINRDVVGPFASVSGKRTNDFVLKGDVIEGVMKLATLLDWKDAMDEVVSEAAEHWKGNAASSEAAPNTKAVSQDQTKKVDKESESETFAKSSSVVTSDKSSNVRSYHTFSGSPARQGQQPAVRMTHFVTSESLSRPNSVARRVPLLPFRLSHGTEVQSLQGDFKAIDPRKDLASAGIGLGKARSNPRK